MTPLFDFDRLDLDLLLPRLSVTINIAAARDCAQSPDQLRALTDLVEATSQAQRRAFQPTNATVERV